MIPVKMPTTGIDKKQPAVIAHTFANSVAPNVFMGQPQGRPLKQGRGGVKITQKNPFQGAINKEALSLRRY